MNTPYYSTSDSEKYHSIFSSIDEGFVISELLYDDSSKAYDLRVLEANRRFHEMLGINDSVGKRAKEIFPDVDDSWFEMYQQVVDTGKALRFENFLAERNKWFELYISRVGDEGSKVFVIVFNDVTERKRQLERQDYLLKLSDALQPLADSADIQAAATRVLGEHLNATHCFYSEVEADGEHSVITNGFHRGTLNLDGRHRMDSFGKSWIDSVRAGHTTICTDVLTDNGITTEERDMTLSIGVRSHANVPLVKNGQFVAKLTVTDSKPREWSDEEVVLVKETAERTWAALEKARAENAYREEQHKLSLAQQAGQVGVWTLDPLSRTGTATSVWYWITAYPSMSDSGKWNLDNFLESIHTDDHPNIIGSFERAYHYSKEIDVEFRLHHPVLGDRWMLMRGSRMWSVNEIDNSLMGTIIDITDRKAAEEQKEQFIGIASHELKTPVTAIKAYGELLEEMFTSEGLSKPAGLMNKMNGQLNKLVKLIEDLLDITRITGGNLELETSDFDLAQMLRENIEVIQLTTSHTLTLHSCCEMLVHADRARIEQVIINLLSNAIKYSKESSNVEISCKEDGEMAVVSVRDSGIGMTPQTKRTIFGRFARANDTAVNNIPGLGLGLYVANGIIKRHGGRMWVESEPGEGSTFYFSIPRGPLSR